MWNTLYGIGIAAFSLGAGLHLAYRYATSKNIVKLKTAIVSLCIGYAFFGLGTMAWFYIEYTTVSQIPFPSYADVFYIAQFPLILFSILLFNRKDKVRAFLDSFVTSLSVLFIVFILSLYFFGVENIANVFFLIYFPFESVFIFCVSAAKFFNIDDVDLKTLLLGNFVWLVADISFVQRYLDGTFYEGGFSDLFYLVGVFLVFIGLSLHVDGKNLLHLLRESPDKANNSNLIRLPASLNSKPLR